MIEAGPRAGFFVVAGVEPRAIACPGTPCAQGAGVAAEPHGDSA
jgi:hypothetical protein